MSDFQQDPAPRENLKGELVRERGDEALAVPEGDRDSMQRSRAHTSLDARDHLHEVAQRTGDAQPSASDLHAHEVRTGVHSAPAEENHISISAIETHPQESVLHALAEYLDGQEISPEIANIIAVQLQGEDRVVFAAMFEMTHGSSLASILPDHAPPASNETLGAPQQKPPLNVDSDRVPSLGHTIYEALTRAPHDEVLAGQLVRMCSPSEVQAIAEYLAPRLSAGTAQEIFGAKEVSSPQVTQYLEDLQERVEAGNLREALSRNPLDIDEVLGILAQYSSQELAELFDEYSNLYGTDIVSDLHNALSEREYAEALALIEGRYDDACLLRLARHLDDGADVTSELLRLFGDRSVDERISLSERFEELYGKSLQDALAHLPERMRNLCAEIIQSGELDSLGELERILRTIPGVSQETIEELAQLAPVLPRRLADEFEARTKTPIERLIIERFCDGEAKELVRVLTQNAQEQGNLAAAGERRDSLPITWVRRVFQNLPFQAVPPHRAAGMSREQAAEHVIDPRLEDIPPYRTAARILLKVRAAKARKPAKEREQKRQRLRWMFALATSCIFAASLFMSNGADFRTIGAGLALLVGVWFLINRAKRLHSASSIRKSLSDLPKNEGAFPASQAGTVPLLASPQPQRARRPASASAPTGRTRYQSAAQWSSAGSFYIPGKRLFNKIAVS